MLHPVRWKTPLSISTQTNLASVTTTWSYAPFSSLCSGRTWLHWLRNNLYDWFYYFNRKGGTNRLIKIYHRNGRYGFSEPYEFKSVQELVEHFKTHSLAEYNRTLNCSLEYPVVNQPVSYDRLSLYWHDIDMTLHISDYKKTSVSVSEIMYVCHS